MSRYLSIFAFILVLALLYSCTEKKEITGKPFIHRDTLVEVLVDIYLVDGITNDRKFYRKYKDVDSVDVLGPILDKYQITRQMFDTTMFVYTREPALLEEVYSDVLNQLNEMMEENDNTKEQDEALLNTEEE